ncbi:hypothetical protein GGI15_001740 [Coemansia interrupta]|uniref:Extradiol ring-cleavage dioxygenase class III enzyme subunit B domain-containing protein n=1 Tax=Coemansia interrupta TaxID=1126814 RepID=A0A9W8LNG3_9FUNG|nr:hypothetical protein GGI15_001740 [Coemansia interrupta]
MSSTSSSGAMPVYFVSHGGPNLLDPTDYPPSEPIAQGLSKIGREILALNPRALLILSGHWEAGPASLQINSKSAQPQPLIYDFYGFPASFYEEKFPHTASPQFAQEVASLVSQADIPIDLVDRGLDHGVWVVLKKAGLADAPFPIVQLSLFHDDSMERHVRLGEALSELRKRGVVVVGSGMAVHNLRDLFGPGATRGVRDYVPLFDKEIEAALNSDDRRRAVVDLAHSDYLRSAHPTLEHLLPLHVAVGAAKDAANVEKMLEAYQVSMSWSCYKFT